MANHRRNAGNGFGGLFSNFGSLFKTSGSRGARGGGAHRAVGATRAPMIVRTRTRQKYGRGGKPANTRSQMADRPSIFTGGINASRASKMWWR